MVIQVSQLPACTDAIGVKYIIPPPDIFVKDFLVFFYKYFTEVKAGFFLRKKLG